MSEDQAPYDAQPKPEAPTPPPPLAPCPCGTVPENLLIEMPDRAKYGRAMGDCCGDWSIEFKNGYTQDPEKTTARAREAWNDAPRAEPIPASSDA